MASQIEPVREDGRVVFRVSGTLDRDCAWELREQLGGETADVVVLDFSRVRDFDDLGIALIAHGLNESAATGTRRSVSLHGLRLHQRRLFRYFGVDAEDLQGGGEPVGPAQP